MRLYIKALALLTSPYYVWYWFLLSMSWCQLAQTSKLTKVGALGAIVISTTIHKWPKTVRWNQGI
jgi:hypothetical protein